MIDLMLLERYRQLPPGETDECFLLVKKAMGGLTDGQQRQLADGLRLYGERMVKQALPGMGPLPVGAMQQGGRDAVLRSIAGGIGMGGSGTSSMNPAISAVNLARPTSALSPGHRPSDGSDWMQYLPWLLGPAAGGLLGLGMGGLRGAGIGAGTGLGLVGGAHLGHHLGHSIGGPTGGLIGGLAGSALGGAGAYMGLNALLPKKKKKHITPYGVVEDDEE